jgi:purine catabolism regulator
MRSLSSLQGAAAFPETLCVRDILSLPGFSGSSVVVGAAGLSHHVEQVDVIQVPTHRYAKRDELIMSSATTFERFAEEAEAFVAALAARRVAALAIRGAPPLDCLGDLGLDLAERESLPIIELPPAAHLNELQAEVLERIVAWQSRQLRIAEGVRDRLSSLVLSGVEIESLPRAIAEIIGGDVAVFDAAGAMIARFGAAGDRSVHAVRRWLAEDRSDPVVFGGSWVIWPSLAGTKRLGCLVARLDDPHRPLHLAALEHGATIAALKILQRQEASEASSRLAAGFVDDLLSGSLDEVSANRRARAVGWEPDHDYSTILTTRPDRGLSAVADSLRSSVLGALVTERSGHCLAVVTSEHLDVEPVPEQDPVDQLAGRISDLYPEVYIGISSRHRGVRSLPMAVAEADEALQAAQIFSRKTRVRAFDQIGLLRLLLDVPAEELRAFPSSVLEPLDRLPSPFRQSLLATLELLIECGLNVAEAARRGGWHYNTVRSRTVRLTELLGPFTEDGRQLDAIALALLLRRELAPAEG